jgi:membrane-bound serine protease (ClpP class)
MVLGALMLINTRMPGGSVSLGTALAVTLPFALITVFLLRLVIKARQTKVATGAAGMVGEIGRAETPLAPEGKIYVHGELWQAVSSQEVRPGTLVRVKSMDGMTLEVEPVSASQPEASSPQPQ